MRLVVLSERGMSSAIEGTPGCRAGVRNCDPELLGLFWQPNQAFDFSSATCLSLGRMEKARANGHLVIRSDKLALGLRLPTSTRRVSRWDLGESRNLEVDRPAGLHQKLGARSIPSSYLGSLVSHHSPKFPVAERQC